MFDLDQTHQVKESPLARNAGNTTERCSEAAQQSGPAGAPV
jgi:hypothetical protein